MFLQTFLRNLVPSERVELSRARLGGVPLDPPAGA